MPGTTVSVIACPIVPVEPSSAPAAVRAATASRPERRGLIDRIGGRDAFRRLREEGRVIRDGPLSLVVRCSGRGRPALGFAIPRKVGTAVKRNRLRRRLREIFRELDRDGQLLEADYLVLARTDAATLDFTALRAHVHRLNLRARNRS